jgi:hypothetical protein
MNDHTEKRMNIRNKDKNGVELEMPGKNCGDCDMSTSYDFGPGPTKALKKNTWFNACIHCQTNLNWGECKGCLNSLMGKPSNNKRSWSSACGECVQGSGRYTAKGKHKEITVKRRQAHQQKTVAIKEYGPLYDPRKEAALERQRQRWM